MEQYCVAPWSFGQEGEVKHKLKSVCHLATNTQGHFFIADRRENVKVVESSGNHLFSSDADCPYVFVKGIATVL